MLNNPATLDDNSPPASEADLSCDEYMVFAIQDRKHHRFSLGLGAVLECLHAAEKEVINLVAITFFRKTIEMNNIAALIILAVAFGLPGFVLTGAAASRTENRRI